MASPAEDNLAVAGVIPRLWPKRLTRLLICSILEYSNKRLI
jgi:hypothetical protein